MSESPLSYFEFACQKSGAGIDSRSSVCRMNCRGFDTLHALHALFLSQDLRKQALLWLRDLQGGRYAEIRRPKPPAKIDLSSLIAVRAPSPG